MDVPVQKSLSVGRPSTEVAVRWTSKYRSCCPLDAQLQKLLSVGRPSTEVAVRCTSGRSDARMPLFHNLLDVRTQEVMPRGCTTPVFRPTEILSTLSRL